MLRLATSTAFICGIAKRINQASPRRCVSSNRTFKLAMGDGRYKSHPLSTVEAECPRSVDAKLAATIDKELMSEGWGYSLEGLMELAGLSVANAVVDVSGADKEISIGLMCGPGNNGGDGLVAARHLHQFGYRKIEVVYPKVPTRQPFTGLRQQVATLGLQVVEDAADVGHVDIWVDCLFGFSFKPPVRKPFDKLIERINQDQESHAISIAVDVPSGWDVDTADGRSRGGVNTPDALVSLTVPKQFVDTMPKSERDKMIHYIGGRFVPMKLSEQLGFDVPPYRGINQIVRVG